MFVEENVHLRGAHLHPESDGHDEGLAMDDGMSVRDEWWGPEAQVLE